MKKQIFSILVAGSLGAFMVGCGGSDGTTTSNNPQTGNISKGDENPTNKKIDSLIITPTDDGFSFKYNNYSQSNLMYKSKNPYSEYIGEEVYQGEIKIVYEDKTKTFVCKESSIDSNNISYKCEPENYVVDMYNPYANKSYTFKQNEDITFFNAKRTLATIRYNSTIDKVEVIK